MKLFALNALLFLGLSNAYGHDFWLEAKPFYSKLGQSVDIAIYVGEDMFGESLPYIPERYSDFSYTSGNGRKKVSGELGRYPAGFIKPQQPGFYSVGYRSKENMVTLSGEKFTNYLKAEGLDKIIAYRKQHQESDKSAKEIYSRCVKTIIQIGNDPQIDYSRQLFNYTFELTAIDNPYQKKIGESLTVKATYQEKPLANTLISAFTKEVPWEKQQVRSDNNGFATITLNRTGHWLIKSVEMIPSKRKGVNWESFWASLTFQIY